MNGIETLKGKYGTNDRIATQSDGEEIPAIHGPRRELDPRDQISRDTDISREPKSTTDNKNLERYTDESKEKVVFLHSNKG